MPQTDERTLDEITADLGAHYRQWKASEKDKDLAKARFFALATYQCLEFEVADEIWVEFVMADATLDQARLRAEKYHPRYEVDDLRATADGFEAVMIERPSMMRFVFVNAGDGMVYQRQVVAGSTVLDDERLKQEQPDLYNEITFTLPWGEQVVGPLDYLSGKQLGLVQDYLHEGRPSVKLAAPRKATEEELASVAS